MQTCTVGTARRKGYRWTCGELHSRDCPSEGIQMDLRRRTAQPDFAGRGEEARAWF
ncbi:MAG: hypothetical protein K2O99_11580 [Lachnospiraceae bacterium]|nr:hypothetical protein [Lachnospiraceae bacterium]